MRRSWPLSELASILLALLLSATHVRAFGLINFLGQGAEHEKITRLGLAPFEIQPWTLSELAGRPWAFGAVGAPDWPTRGLMLVAAAHCDGGDYLAIPNYPQSAAAAAATLSSCRAWIFENLQAAVEQAGALLDANGKVLAAPTGAGVACAFRGRPEGPKCNVLGALGLALHAAQDFYAHTNWTDVAADATVILTNPPGLGNNGRAPWLDPRLGVDMPAGLISGCFSGLPERFFCRDRMRHSDLNKDTGQIDIASGAIGDGTTARGRSNGNFARAVSAAIDDTRDKWAYFEEQIQHRYGPIRGAAIICVMRKDNPSDCL
jgi:hypothetical protein